MRARRASRPLVLLALAPAALGAVGCDWRDFDSIQARTPVLAVGAPSHFGGTDFGSTILPIHTLPSGADGGRFVVSSAGSVGVAIVDVDAHGDAKSQAVSSPALGTLQPIVSLAEIPGMNQVLMSAPGAGEGTLAIMTMGTTTDVTAFDTQIIDRFGLAVAAGNVAGAAAPDFVVLSGDELDVYVDGDAQMRVAAPLIDETACPLALDPTLPLSEQTVRALVVAPLMGDPGTPQIVIGTPALHGMGAVDVFTVDATTGEASCAFTYRAADPLFGAALATGDFDGDGTPDLLVGSPPDHAFWIQGPLSADSPVLPVALAPGQGALGVAVGAGNFDGKGGDEALIGDTSAAVGGTMLAGEVRVVTGAMLDKELAPLRRHDPGTGDFFGIAVGALPFCTSGCGTGTAVTHDLALVGSTAHAFVDFTSGDFTPAGTDPRKP